MSFTSKDKGTPIQLGMNDQPINNNYLAGYLQSTLRALPSIITNEGIVEWGSTEHKQLERLVEKALKKAIEAEREFSKQ